MPCAEAAVRAVLLGFSKPVWAELLCVHRAPLKSSLNLGGGLGKFCITRFCRRVWKPLPALPMGLSLGSV